MLVIRRRRGESITIGDEIEIEILETSPTQVKVGIRAPKSISVLRKEISLTRDLNRVASGSPAADEKLTTLAEQYRINANSARINKTVKPALNPPMQDGSSPIKGE